MVEYISEKNFSVKLGFLPIWEGLGTHFNMFLGTLGAFLWFGRVLGPGWNSNGLAGPAKSRVGRGVVAI